MSDAFTNGFHFSGQIASSKSILNRLLILKSFSPALDVVGDSQCDDVLAMKQALKSVLALDEKRGDGAVADCGAAGTTFRFMALRAARLRGKTLLHAAPQLLARPQTELLNILKLLGCQTTLRHDGIEIRSEGWKRPLGRLVIDRSQSSQFASAVILSAWGLDFDMEIEMQGDGENHPSEGYFSMTVHLVRSAGMELIQSGRTFFIPKASQIRARRFVAEPDLSSAFALAALGTIGGQVELQFFPEHSLQPDFAFVEILKKMGASVVQKPDQKPDQKTEQRNDTLQVAAATILKPIDWNLRDCPDLFPVLAVLCAYADGPSRLWGAPHLEHKESHRISSTAALLRGLGRRFEIFPDGILIEGRTRVPDLSSVEASKVWEFDPQGDHRLAMAAAVARLAGAPVRILNPDVVNKSFPEFWPIFLRGSGVLL